MTDVVLVSLPNKNMDFPTLALPTLTGALRSSGLSVRQIDGNIDLKDLLISEPILEQLAQEVLPYVWKRNLNNDSICDRINSLAQLLSRVRDEHSFARICEIKRLFQQRRYEEVFGDQARAEAADLLVRVCARSNILFDLLPALGLDSVFPDLAVFQHLCALIEEILAASPRLVGLSIIATQRSFSLWFARKLRYEYGYPGAIVAGGSDIAYFGVKYLEHFEYLDYLIYPEGEEGVVQLARHLRGEAQPLDGIKHIAYRQDGGYVHQSQPEASPAYPAVLPDYDDLPLAKYLSPALAVQASRGCSWGRCSFCNHFTTYSAQYYKRSAAAVADQLEYLTGRYHTNWFHWADDDFDISLKSDVADEILRRGIQMLSISYCRFDSRITRPMLEKWASAGMIIIEWGLESASQAVLTRVQKGTRLPAVQRILLDAHRAGILNKCLMFHNLPGEGYEELQASIDFLTANVVRGVIRPFFELRTPLELFRFTRIYDETFSDTGNRRGGSFAKAWLPRGELTASASYRSQEDHHIKEEMLCTAITYLSGFARRNRVIDVNDEFITVDLILESLRRQGKEQFWFSRVGGR